MTNEFPNGAATSLDFSRLEKLKYVAGKAIARCPACAADGGDRKGNHLVIYPNGKYGCVACPSDAEHNRRIFGFVGRTALREHAHEDEKRWRAQRTRVQLDAFRDRQRIAAAKSARDKILADFEWDLDAVRGDSPQPVANPLVSDSPGHFLSSLFPPDTKLWTGRVFESGVAYADRWRTCVEWSTAPTGERVGPMTTPATWREGTSSRSSGNVLSAPYVVLDFDGFDGIKPKNPEELKNHVLQSLAMIRWIRERLRWRLAAVLWTGGKSLHAWFYSPAEAQLLSIKGVATTLGIDPSLIGQPAHPCRLPGHPHEGSGKTSMVLWLQLHQFSNG